MRGHLKDKSCHCLDAPKISPNMLGGELDQYLDYFKTLFFSVLIDSLFITFKNKFQNVMENNLINLLAIQRRQIPFDLVYHQ